MKKLFEGEAIIRTDLFTVEQDWYVPIPAFFILTPKREIRSIAEFTDEETKEFGDILRKVRRGMDEVLGIKDVYFFQNEDTGHNFHLWIFPRHHWMEKFERKIESVRPIMRYAKDNMYSEEMVIEVKESMSKMREYLQ